MSIFQSQSVTSEQLDFFTDASFSGIGGYFNGRWFSSPWIFGRCGHHIGVLELFGVFVAVKIWGPLLRNRQIVVYTDNESIVSIWESGSSRDEAIMFFVRSLFFLSVEFNISLILKHVPGHKNIFADLLSRLQVRRFLALCQDAFPHPSPLPLQAWKFFSKR